MKYVNDIDYDNPIKGTLFSPTLKDGKRHPIYFNGSDEGAKVASYDVTIPKTGWNEYNGAFNYYLDIDNGDITTEMLSVLLFDEANLPIAQKYGLGDNSPLNGKLRIYAMEIPAAAIPATLCLFGASGGISPTGLPIATKTRAGIVKVGENIDVTSDGTISVPALSDADGNGIPDVIDGASATDEEVDEMLDEVYGKS